MEETENEIDHKRVKDRSPSPAIKSTAVVKYTAVQSPSGYARLQCNTDLNLPPSNWSSSIDSYGLKQILTQSSGLSSFRMAHMFPDCVGEVDVISGAECIKQLLKLPYQPNGTVSMMVHRVENTLLLDDFDVYDYLMKSEWSWLRNFFYENILKTMSEQERMMIVQKRSRAALQLTSKFLCHSVASLPEPKEVKSVCQPTVTPMLEGPHLPEPEARSQAPPNEHLYNRNVVWTFESLQMLIGSDLPIFGGTDRPCVSLKLHDAREPINVLTGIDYWLDNQMCNVPEVLMCYHIDGIVQKYEPLKTEDLPNLDGSKFSPKVIRNVAQNILSFLKSNATKAGHTYWLFKGPHDDVVKLYDLTSLCGGSGGSDGMENPFKTPVAMLLYRVARNKRMTNRTKHVKELLENAIELMSEQRYPQIVASSHYMLADLYVPATTNPACPDFKEQSSDSEEDQEEDLPPQSYPEASSEDTSQLALQIRGLALHDIGEATYNMTYQDQKPNLGKGSTGLGTETPSRCGKALQHALKGLRALHHVTITKCQEEERERLRQQIIIEEQHPKMANPYEPIKMNYQPIYSKKDDKSKEHTSRSRRRKRERKQSEPTNLLENTSNIDKNAILIRKENNVFPSWHEPNRDDNFAWKLHLKTLLYEKTCLAYATLAEYSYANEQYGFSLKYIKMASKCQKLLSNMIIKSRVVDLSCLLGRIGDNYFQFSKHWGALVQFRKQFEMDHDTDALLRLEIDSDILEEIGDLDVSDEFDLDIVMPQNEVDAMLLSCDYYKKAICVTDSEKRNELLRRFGSVSNELGVRYMNDAQSTFIKYTDLHRSSEEVTDEMKTLLKQFNEYSTKSLHFLNEATELFEKVKDIPNLALLYCNKGRYLRFKAHCDSNNTGFNSDRRSLYNQAEDLYQSALKVLGSKECCGAPAIWELVSWELSCHTYTRATLMQDRPRSYFNEANEVAEAFKHALKFCHLSPGPRQYVYQFRAAMIYYKLAALYHKQYRDTTEEGAKRRMLFNLVRTNYEQAAILFAVIEESSMYLCVQLEHVALLETQATNTTNLKLKSLQTALQIIRQCHSMIKSIRDRDPEETKDPPKTEDQDDWKDEHHLLSLLENRLHFILKSIIRYCCSKSNKDYEKMTGMYKKLYSLSLKIKKSAEINVFAASVCEVFDGMDDIVKECD